MEQKEIISKAQHEWVKIEKYKNLPSGYQILVLYSPVFGYKIGRLEWRNGWKSSGWVTNEGEFSMNQFEKFMVVGNDTNSTTH